MKRGTPEQHGMSSDRLQQVESVCCGYVDRGEVVGTVTAVARHGEIVYLESHGMRDRESDTPMTVDTIFRIFSMTKPITSVAALILFEEGRLRLADPVSRFFPHFRTMAVYTGGDEPPFDTVEADREITIRDLLTHTSGLAYGIGDEHPVERAFGAAVWDVLAADPALDLDFLAETVAEQPLVHQPGTSWRYSAATDLLAAVVERASGERFEEFVRRRITEPLGMADTSFTVHQAERSRLATLYRLQDDGTLAPGEDPPVMAFRRPTSHPNGGGGLVSTASDYLRFAGMLLGHGALDDEVILGSKTVDLMTRNHLPSAVAAHRGGGFGLGVSVLTDLTTHTAHGSVGEYGWGGAATTRFWVDPQNDLVLVVLLQLMPGFCRPIVDDVHTAVYQAILE